MKIISLCIGILFSVLLFNVSAQNVYDASVPTPTLSDIKYGDHERQVLDFWQAASDAPTPLVLVIHGGGWGANSKEIVHRFVDVQKLLDAHISVVAINYRLIQKDSGLNETPPVKAPMHDAARALQFVRSKSAEWNINKEKIAAAGGSAGACTSLWLAFHDDMKQADSPDPVAQESTRLNAAAVMYPQTSLDPKQMKEWIPQISYGAHAFGIKGFDAFLAARDSIMPWIEEYSPYALVSKGDPSVYMSFNKAPGTEEIRSHFTHSAIFGVELQKQCEKQGVKCEVYYKGAPDSDHENPTEYLIETLK